MPTRTFIGFILLVFAMLIASTPALLEPLSRGTQKGLDAAGVPGMSPDATFATRAKRKDTGTVQDTLHLKGYAVDESDDMRDLYAPGDREDNQMEVNGRTKVGARRTRLPGYTSIRDENSPPVRSADGVLLDRSGCPVFRANLDLPALWKAPAQQKKYLDKAGAADDPAVCRARLEALVNNASTGLKNQPTARETARMLRADDITYSIMMEHITIMESMFPGSADARALIFAGSTAAEDDAAAKTTTAAGDN